MAEQDTIRIEVNPAISAEQLFSFYQRNNICETGFGKDRAARVLTHSSLIVAAFQQERLVGIARAMFDGLSAAIMEFSLEVTFQGIDPKDGNGSLMQGDASGVGKRLGEVFLDELLRVGATFISVYIVADCEEPFYHSLGFQENTGHLVYYIDRRPYVLEGQPGR